MWPQTSEINTCTFVLKVRSAYYVNLSQFLLGSSVSFSCVTEVTKNIGVVLATGYTGVVLTTKDTDVASLPEFKLCTYF